MKDKDNNQITGKSSLEYAIKVGQEVENKIKG